MWIISTVLNPKFQIRMLLLLVLRYSYIFLFKDTIPDLNKGKERLYGLPFFSFITVSHSADIQAF